MNIIINNHNNLSSHQEIELKLIINQSGIYLEENDGLKKINDNTSISISSEGKIFINKSKISETNLIKTNAEDPLNFLYQSKLLTSP